LEFGASPLGGWVAGKTAFEVRLRLFGVCCLEFGAYPLGGWVAWWLGAGKTAVEGGFGIVWNLVFEICLNFGA
jgi:hypothetical protein